MMWTMRRQVDMRRLETSSEGGAHLPLGEGRGERRGESRGEGRQGRFFRHARPAAWALLALLLVMAGSGGFGEEQETPARLPAWARGNVPALMVEAAVDVTRRLAPGLEQLRRQEASEDEEERGRAALTRSQLAERASGALSSLLTVAMHGPPEQKSLACRLLAVAGTDEAVEALTLMLTHPRLRHLRESALGAVALLADPQPVIELASSLLDEPDREDILIGLDMIERCGLGGQVKKVPELLNHPDALVRTAAFLALTASESEAAGKALKDYEPRTPLEKVAAAGRQEGTSFDPRIYDTQFALLEGMLREGDVGEKTQRAQSIVYNKLDKLIRDLESQAKKQSSSSSKRQRGNRKSESETGATTAERPEEAGKAGRQGISGWPGRGRRRHGGHRRVTGGRVRLGQPARLVTGRGQRSAQLGQDS